MASQRQDRGWQVGKSLPDRMWHLFEDQMCTDVTFVFPGEQTNRSQAHKVVLIAGSPVFEAMFSGNFIETESDVKIVDITPGIFREFLRYLYTDEAHVDAENVLPLMYTAKKYIVDGLNDICGSFLTKDINDENVCKILDDSIEYGVESLTERCVNYILPRAGNVIKTQGFSSISQKALQLIVQSDELDINEESEVYDACIIWAKSHCPGMPSNQDIRNQLGPCLLQIRFHQMSVDDFANKMGEIDILTDKEKSVLYSYLVTKRADTKPKLQELNFNLGRRITIGRIEIPCYNPDSGVQIVDEDDQTLKFSFNSGPKLRLRGICLYGTQQAGITQTITITLLETPRTADEVAGQSDSSDDCDEWGCFWNQQNTITWTGNAEPTNMKIEGARYLVPHNTYKISLKTNPQTAATPDGDVICQPCRGHGGDVLQQQFGGVLRHPFGRRSIPPSNRAGYYQNVTLNCQQCGGQFRDQRHYYARNVRYDLVEFGDITFDFSTTIGLNRLCSDPTRFAKFIVCRV